MAWLQADVGFFPMAAPAHEAAVAFFLALDVRDLHRLDLDFLVLGAEHQLDRRLDFGLGRIRSNAKRILIVFFPDESALLGYDRSKQHLHQALGVLGAGCSGAHFSSSSNLAIAFLVSKILSWRIKLTRSA